ncbi:serine/threonine protein kinase [Sorangium sp. So ce1153]|uniref:serine/threonine protein kinase n=1 Tax=Sorangium sp. So ce1153 TaxID=3133333 RepID=UPI003F5FA168
MAWIDLLDGNKRLGNFDVPNELIGRKSERFRIGYAIKKGGNGVVFKATRTSVPGASVCAVKVLRRLDDARYDRFMNEVRIVSNLSHPRIAPAYDSGSFHLDDRHEVPWVAMELGDRNLREHIESGGPLPPKTLISVSIELCEALGYLHEQRIIHRDIKPDNFVWLDGGSQSVRMIDFGIAKYVGEDVSTRPLDQFTQQMEFVGPVFFASPELIAYARNKQHPVDHRSDLFQLAKVIWYLGTGRILAGVPARKLCPLEGKLWDALITSLSDDPDDRPASASELAEQLRNL